MLIVTVEFTHGWLRAGPTSDARLTGGDRRGEWPPSPGRLLAAFVAADGTRGRQRGTDGAELRLLEEAPPPMILADPDDQVLRAQINDRYVVRNQRANSAVQGYPARSSTLVRPGVRLIPRTPTIAYCYDIENVSDQQLRALRFRAARIGYLGAADAPARITVERRQPTSQLHRWRAHDAGATPLAVGYPGMVDDLDVAFDLFLAGEIVERSWTPKKIVRYRADQQNVFEPRTDETIWLKFSRAISSHHVIAITEALRAAVLHHHPDGAEAPAIVHGHGNEQPSWHQVRFLPLVEAGHQHSKGRIHGAGIWVPAAATRHDRDGIRTAALSIRRLWHGDRFDVAVTLHDGEPRPWTANPARWIGPARQWSSVTPVVQERHGPVTHEEVARWFTHAGHPVPEQFVANRHPDLAGAIDLRPPIVRRRYGRSPYTHITVEFEEPVFGPLAVGRGRSFGLGLLAPIKEANDA